jgi:S1-C subfamily serine protease
VRRFLTNVSMVLVLAACSATSGAAASPTAATVAQQVAAGTPSITAAAPLQAQTTSPSDFSTAIQTVANSVRPTVVQITNMQSQVGSFNQGAAVPAGVGSGVIYDGAGHILTNDHVVAGAQQLQVSLPDKRSFAATMVGEDPQTDLAVVQISGDNLPIAELGASSNMQVGAWVVAIGNALALPGGPTVTQGVVSATGRTVQEPGQTPNTAGPFLFDAIQTDAPINPGNSGGALVNLNGQVIGINTLVATQAEPGVSAQGIGFAIAIDTAKPIADQLVTTGHAVHPYLGIAYGPLTPSLAVRLGVNTDNGFVVGQVAPGSPAASAGIQPGDVIIAVDGQPLDSESALAQNLNQHKPGDSITLTVIRNGQQQSIQVTLGAAPTPGH